MQLTAEKNELLVRWPILCCLKLSKFKSSLPFFAISCYTSRHHLPVHRGAGCRAAAAVKSSEPPGKGENNAQTSPRTSSEGKLQEQNRERGNLVE